MSNFITKSQVLVLSNSALAWARTKNEEYCVLHGIPATNILEFDFGTTEAYWEISPTPTSVQDSKAAMDVVISGILDWVNEHDTSAILLGFGVPLTVNWYGYVSGGSTVNGFQVSDLAGPLTHPRVWRLDQLCYPVQGTAGRISDWRTNPTFSATGGTSLYNGYSIWDCGDSTSLNNTSYDTTYSFTSDPSFTPHVQDILTFESYYQELNEEYWTRFGTSRSNRFFAGKIGHTSSGYANPAPSGFLDDETNADIVLARIAQNLQDYDRTAAQDYPILIQIRAAAGFPEDGFANQAYLLDQWGYTVKYFYRQPEDGTCALYAPKSAEEYDWVGGYRPVNDPYYIMFGEGENTTEMYNSPYTECWQPMNGAFCHMGPSDGPEYNMQALKLGAIGGMKDPGHYTSAMQGGQRWKVITRLLRGASLAMTSTRSVFAIGDPLWEPFGRNSVYPVPTGGALRSGAMPRARISRGRWR